MGTSERTDTPGMIVSIGEDAETLTMSQDDAIPESEIFLGYCFPEESGFFDCRLATAGECLHCGDDLEPGETFPVMVSVGPWAGTGLFLLCTICADHLRKFFLRTGDPAERKITAVEEATKRESRWLTYFSDPDTWLRFMELCAVYQEAKHDYP